MNRIPFFDLKRLLNTTHSSHYSFTYLDVPYFEIFSRQLTGRIRSTRKGVGPCHVALAERLVTADEKELIPGP
jgi:hypothetical protein